MLHKLLLLAVHQLPALLLLAVIVALVWIVVIPPMSCDEGMEEFVEREKEGKHDR